MKDYYKMEHFFKTKSEFRVRSEKKMLEDNIHRGVYEADLEAVFSRGAIREGMLAGVIAKRKIALGGTQRNVYVWLDEPLGQVRWWKRFWNYCCVMFRREE